MECRKCHSKNLFTKEKGTQTGLYCEECGAWQKWVPKKELATVIDILEAQKIQKTEPEQKQNLDEYHGDDNFSFYDKLQEYVVLYEKSETNTAEEEQLLEKFLTWVKFKEM